MALGSLTLSPTFSPDVYAYTTNSTSATNTLTATAEDTGAEITKALNGVEFSGNTVTWTAETDTLTIEVDSGSVSNTYTITCTHTE